MSTRSYQELILLPTFEERFEYLKLDGSVSDPTFGFNRYLNQQLYKSAEWKRFRNRVIVRDGGCDLATEGFEIFDKILIHHINPLTQDDILNASAAVFDLNNVICVSLNTHNAIHYGNADSIQEYKPVVRQPRDHILW